MPLPQIMLAKRYPLTWFHRELNPLCLPQLYSQLLWCVSHQHMYYTIADNVQSVFCPSSWVWCREHKTGPWPSVWVSINWLCSCNGGSTQVEAQHAIERAWRQFQWHGVQWLSIWQRHSGEWRRGWEWAHSIHLGKGRNIWDDGPTFHQSVKDRMEDPKLKYKPRAIWKAGTETYVT